MPVDFVLLYCNCFLRFSSCYCGCDSLSFEHFHFSAIMVQSTRHPRALRERSRSRDDPHERHIPMWQPHPSTRGNEFRESWQEVPRPEQHRDVLIFVCLKAIPDLMRQHHDNIMHWTSCDTLPLLGRQEEHALYTFSTLLTKERLETFTVYNLLYMISPHIWNTWDRFLRPSSMDLRWSDETDDTFVLHEEDKSWIFSIFIVLIGLKAKNMAWLAESFSRMNKFDAFHLLTNLSLWDWAVMKHFPIATCCREKKADVTAALSYILSRHWTHVSYLCLFLYFSYSSLAPAVTWLNVTLLPLVSPLRLCRPMFIVANAIRSPMPTTTQRNNTHMLGHHTWPIHHHRLGLQLPSMQDQIHHTNPTSPPMSIQDQPHLTPLTPLINPRFSLSKNRPCQTGIRYIMHQLHHGVKCMLSTSMKSVNLAKMTLLLRNVIWW